MLLADKIFLANSCELLVLRPNQTNGHSNLTLNTTLLFVCLSISTTFNKQTNIQHTWFSSGSHKNEWLGITNPWCKKNFALNFRYCQTKSYQNKQIYPNRWARVGIIERLGPGTNIKNYDKVEEVSTSKIRTPYMSGRPRSHCYLLRSIWGDTGQWPWHKQTNQTTISSQLQKSITYRLLK